MNDGKSQRSPEGGRKRSPHITPCHGGYDYEASKGDEMHRLADPDQGGRAGVLYIHVFLSSPNEILNGRGFLRSAARAWLCISINLF